MNCKECQWNIAAERDDVLAVREHLGRCESCQRFASELAENAAALRSIEPDGAAYAAVRARVMQAVTPKRRFSWWWAPALAGTVGLVMVLWMNAMLAPKWTEPAAITYRVGPPANWAMVGEAPRRPIANRPQVKNLPHVLKNEPQLTAIKMLTDDPNVVIIWLVDNKKGDSL